MIVAKPVILKDVTPLRMGHTSSLETSVLNYLTPRHKPEDEIIRVFSYFFSFYYFSFSDLQATMSEEASTFTQTSQASQSFFLIVWGVNMSYIYIYFILFYYILFYIVNIYCKYFIPTQYILNILTTLHFKHHMALT
jgi:hypothetical protein